MGFLTDVGVESARLLDKMSIYVLFGLLVAGALHTYVPSAWLVRNLSGGRLWPVVKAALVGIPLPLCSCGVLPAAVSLRRDGAGRGAVISFLVATPTTGVDSILATYALLGKVFAVYRVAASFLAATVAGIASTLTSPREQVQTTQDEPCECGSCSLPEEAHPRDRLAAMLRYSFVDLVGDIGKWLVIGLVIGGLITALIPDEWVESYLGSGWVAMLVMLAIGIPLYVCSTGSIPIAAALMLKGMSPGAAFVFLLAGPATNAVTVTFVARYLGRVTTVVYLASLAVSSLLLGWLLDRIWAHWQWGPLDLAVEGHEIFPGWLTASASVVLVALIGFGWLARRRGPTGGGEPLTSAGYASTVVEVSGMTCGHCERTVRAALVVDGVLEVRVSAEDGRAWIRHRADVPPDTLVERVRAAGYPARIAPDSESTPASGSRRE